MLNESFVVALAFPIPHLREEGNSRVDFIHDDAVTRYVYHDSCEHEVVFFTILR